VRWGGLEAVLEPRSLARARLHDPGEGSPFPIVDFEPHLSRTFYDDVPFDFSSVSDWKPAPLLAASLDRQPDGQRRLDAGCGAGRNVASLLGTTEHVVVLDLSLRSLSHVASRFPVRPARGSVLHMPFIDGSFDFVVCDGVAHCTPDPAGALAEGARVTRPGGRLYLGIYRAGSLYQRLYTHLGALLRAGRRLRPPTLSATIDRVAFAGYRGATRLWRPHRVGHERALRAIYEDYFHTPGVSFHTPVWTTSTLERYGMQVEQIERCGNIWSVVARKRS
jgi:SAM-dependent methyltransferase